MNFWKTTTPLVYVLKTVSWLGSFAIAASSFAAPAPASFITSTNQLLPGTRFATECYVHDTGKPGPTLMIVGGAHGNEPAGAHAAETIRHWPLRSGKLIVIPRANVPALAANKRLTPGLNTNLNNLNRNYPRTGKDESPRSDLAEAIWAMALAQKPDWLLDLHEGYDFNAINDKSVGSSVIVTQEAQGKAAADLMLAAVNKTITDEKLKFARRGPPIDASLARAAGEHLHIPAMTLETTSKQPMPKRVRQHEIMVHALLHHLDMMDAALPPESFVESAALAATAEKPIKLRVALYKGPGTGGNGPPSLMKRLQNPPESSITQVTPEEIAGGILTNYNIVIFGGGSGSKQAEALGETGRMEVCKFVEKGGGYIGICAGAYLATSGYPWSLGLINARTISPKWARGKGIVKLELTDAGRDLLGERGGQFDCLYANGPVVKRDEKTNLPPFEILAHFRTEFASNGSPAGIMVNSPAIFSASYQQGRVVCVSPHPEQTKGLESIVPQAINWVAPREKIVSEKPATRAE